MIRPVLNTGTRQSRNIQAGMLRKHLITQDGSTGITTPRKCKGNSSKIKKKSQINNITLL